MSDLPDLAPAGQAVQPAGDRVGVVRADSVNPASRVDVYVYARTGWRSGARASRPVSDSALVDLDEVGAPLGYEVMSAAAVEMDGHQVWPVDHGRVQACAAADMVWVTHPYPTRQQVAMVPVERLPAIVAAYLSGFEGPEG